MATAAERSRRNRDRKRRGNLAVVPVEVSADVIAALQWNEYLDLDASDDAGNVTDKGALAEAIQAALGDLAEEAHREWQAEEATAAVPAVSGPSTGAAPEAA